MSWSKEYHQRLESLALFQAAQNGKGCTKPMGWEKRNGRQYYYTAKKIKGKVVKEYVGTGPAAERIALMEAHYQKYQQSELLVRKLTRAKSQSVDAIVDDFCNAVTEIIRSTLTAQGYHRHDRGSWRKKRPAKCAAASSKMDESKKGTIMQASEPSSDFVALSTATETVTSEEEEDETLPEDSGDRIEALLSLLNQTSSDVKQIASAGSTQPSGERVQSLADSFSADFADLLVRAEGGDPGARLPLRALLKHMGDTLSTASTAEKTLDTFLESSYGLNILAAEVARKEANAMRVSLAGVDPSPLDSLLIEQVILCWAQINYHEKLYALMLPQLKDSQHRVYQERVDRAQRRYLRAIKTLAQVRKLQLPMPTPLQVNIATQGGQQINVASD